MGLWGPHYLVDSHPVHLGIRYGAPYWLSRMWNPTAGASPRAAGGLCHAPHPIGPCDPSRVPSAYFVELRALEIAKEELEPPTPQASTEEMTGWRRLWPFRWPEKAEAPPPPPPPPRQLPDQILGRFLDVYA